MGRTAGAISVINSILGKRSALSQIRRYSARQRLIREILPVRGAAQVVQEEERMPSFSNGTLTRGRRRYGRSIKRGSNAYARLMLRATANRLVFGLSDYTSFGDANGAHYLENWFPGAPGPYYTPCHLYDVSSAPNNVDGSQVTAQCGYKLTFTDPTNGANLVWVSHSNANQVLNSGHTETSTQSVPNNRSMLRGVAAKFMFYSAQTIPTRVRVSLIQINEDKYHPPKTASGTHDNVGPWVAAGTAYSTVTDRSVVAMWQSAVHNYVKNPVCVGDGNSVRRQIKVLKSHSFILNPKETSDNTSATYHAFNMYHKFSRRMTYNWADQDKVDMRNNDEQFIDAAVNKCSVAPRARLYIMVQADSKYNSGAAQVTTGAPSYDITLRMYHDDLGA